MTNQEKADLFCKEWLEGRSTFTINTSGSTGAPKIIQLRREQMIASAKRTIKALDLQKGMTSLVCLDVSFIAGKMMLVRSLIAGMNMIVVEPKANPFEDLPDKKIDFAAMVPYQLSTLIIAGKAMNIGKIILGGAPASQLLLREIRDLRVPVYATFGMTETITHIALRKLNGDDEQDYFEVLEGVGISTDDRGCLVIRADYLDDVVTTNDIIELVDVGKFRWLGRFDDVINSGGIKILPGTIERAIEEYFSSGDIGNRFFVAGRQHEQLGQQVVLVVEGDLAAEEEENLLDWLRKTLSKYEIPKVVLYADHFAMTETQKINRRSSMENALPRPNSLR
jgi:O-succinylbenzoic acid--CoA ligase